MIVCYECQGSGIIISPGNQPANDVGLTANWVDGSEDQQKQTGWPSGTTPMKCPSCLGNGYQTNFGVTLY